MNRLGPYEILGEVGRGGMGVVYRARHAETGAPAALKAIPPGDAATPEQLARFQREARIASELDHPGIVRFLEAGETDGTAWFAMELVEGRSLDHVALNEEWEWRRVVETLRDVADALAYAHGKAVLHRDVKPSNILVETGTGQGLACPRAKLADFGLAKDVTTGSKYTHTGQTLGTPNYMSPEQARGEVAALTPATDVWSMGCVLYELLAGRQAFEGDTFAAVVGHVVAGEPLPLAQLRPDLPAGVTALVGACLAKERGDRPPNGRALRDDLDAVLQDGLPRHQARPRRRGGFWAGAALAAAAILGTAAGLWSGVGRQSPPPAPPPDRSELMARVAWGRRDEDPRRGADEMAEVLTRHPQRHQWRMQYGILRWRHGDGAAAREAWGMIPEGAPAFRAAQVHIAMEIVFRMGGGWHGFAVREHAERAATGEDRTAQLARALICMAGNDPAGAATAVQDTEGWEAALIRSMSNTGGDHAARLRDLDAAIGGGARIAFAYYTRAATKYWLEDWAGAVADASIALELEPGNVEALALRGNCHHRAGRLAEALEDLELALAIDPKHVESLVQRGTVHQRNGDAAKARRDFDAALALKPRHPVARVSRARLHLAAGELPQALEDLNVAIASGRATPRAWRERGLVHKRLRRMQEAVADFTQAIALDETDVEAWTERGAAKTSLKDVDGAMADWDRAIEIDPAYGPARTYRGMINLQRGNYAAAIDDFERALRRAPPQWPHRARVAKLLEQARAQAEKK